MSVLTVILLPQHKHSADKPGKGRMFLMRSKSDLFKTARLIETGEFVAIESHDAGYFFITNHGWIHGSKLYRFVL